MLQRRLLTLRGNKNELIERLAKALKRKPKSTGFLKSQKGAYFCRVL